MVPGSFEHNRRTKNRFIAVTVGLIIFVLDVFAFNGDAFSFLLAALVTTIAASKWLFAWTPLRMGERIALAGLAAVPWAIAWYDPYASLHGAAVFNIAWVGIALLVLSRINGRA